MVTCLFQVSDIAPFIHKCTAVIVFLSFITFSKESITNTTQCIVKTHAIIQKASVTMVSVTSYRLSKLTGDGEDF